MAISGTDYKQNICCGGLSCLVIGFFLVMGVVMLSVGQQDFTSFAVFMGFMIFVGICPFSCLRDGLRNRKYFNIDFSNMVVPELVPPHDIRPIERNE